MTFLKSFLFIIFLNINLYATENSQDYLFEEMFEAKENLKVKFWVTNLNKNKDINISYSLDKKNFTQGKSSLKIDVSSLGFSDITKEWYYYLKIPLSPIPNLEKKLTFSIDVKMDKKSASNIQIGFDLKYLPISSGIYAFNKIDYSKYNKWTTLKHNNLKSLFTKKHANNFISNIYGAKLNSFGRTISNIVILIKGRGKQKYQINLDNLKISGKIMSDYIFIKKFNKNWSTYIKKVRKDVKEKRKIYKALIDKSRNKNFSKDREYLKKRIDSLFIEINNILNHTKVLKTSKIELLDFYLKRLKSFDSITELYAYKIPSMKYYRLTGYNTPLLKEIKSFNIRMVKDEYKSIAILIESGSTDGLYSLYLTDFKGKNGVIPKENLDMYIAKIWYQSGLNTTIKTGKFLTQELLLKDENLVKVDYKNKVNYLRVKYIKNNLVKYIRISDTSDIFPREDLISFNDKKKLQPFRLDLIRHKLLWGILHIPKKTKEGYYTSSLKIKNEKGTIVKTIPIYIQVLPFNLDASKIDYSLYYTGKLTKNKVLPLNAYRKTKKQQEIELKDIKKHGVMYPISYEKIDKLNDTLNLRDKIGFPKDKFFTIGFNIMDNNLEKKILEYKKVLSKHKYNKDNLFIYAIDEASIEILKKEIAYIKKVHKYKSKVFVAGYSNTYNYLGEYLDLFNYAEGSIKENAKQEVQKWHTSKKKIFVYASPQAGLENPEIYRRNFGCKLWKKGFDGAMNWAYQAQRGAFWNDFDEFSSYKSKYREEAFTYPTTDGIIGTIQWEGFREAITDVKYISTLENLRDKLKDSGNDISTLSKWIENIDCNSDLDKLRENIIDKILEYKSKYEKIR